MFTLIFLSLLALTFVGSIIMVPVAIAQANKIRTATPAGTQPIIPWYYNWVIWFIIFLLSLFLLCVLLAGGMFLAAIPSPLETRAEAPLVVATNEGTPVQFGLFPVQGGFGINAVIGSSSKGENFTFSADGNTITPYTIDCRDFSDYPFYGATTVTRCDYLFRDHGYDYVSVDVPNTFDIMKHGITLVKNAVAISDNTWALP